MKFIRITFYTLDEKSKKKGLITANIFDGKAMIKFENQEQTTFTYNALIKAGKKAIQSRGLIIQFFTGIKKEEIKEILKEDIKNGLAATGKRKITIEDYKEELR